MRRRDVIQLFAAAAASLWARPAKALLTAAGAPALQSAEPLLPLFPLPLVLFPGTNLPLHIFEPRYKEMIADCLQNQSEFGILLARGEKIESVGCTAGISNVLRRYPDGRMDILVHGRRRFEVSLLNREKPYLRGRAESFPEDESASVDSRDKALVDPSEGKLRLQAIALHGRLAQLLEEEPPADPPQEQPPEPERSEREFPFDPNTPRLSFQMMSEVPADLEWKQRLLEIRSERERLTTVVRYLERLIEYMEQSPGGRGPVNRAALMP